MLSLDHKYVCWVRPMGFVSLSAILFLLAVCWIVMVTFAM